jgi:hypothetical protein
MGLKVSKSENFSHKNYGFQAEQVTLVTDIPTMRVTAWQTQV